MIVQAVVILLIILVVANIGLGFFNNAYPPCFDDTDYYSRVSSMPDSALAGLSSITGRNSKFNSQNEVDTDPDTTTWESVYNDKCTKTSTLEHPIFESLDDENGSTVVSDGYSRKQSCEYNNKRSISNKGDNLVFAGGSCQIVPGGDNEDSSAYDAISAMYPSASQKISSNEFKPVKGGQFHLETEFEGMRANVKKSMSGPARKPATYTERDGYSSR
jgi:hypothetical protein